MLIEPPGFTNWYASFVISVSIASSGAIRMLTANANADAGKGRHDAGHRMPFQASETLPPPKGIRIR